MDIREVEVFDLKSFVYILHKLVFSYINIYFVFPCAFALVSDRKTSTYEQIIQILKSTAIDMLTKFEPVVLMSDFERPLIKAVKRQVCRMHARVVILHCLF